MAVFSQYTHLDLLGNELQNANFQNLATAPSNPTAGRFYFNTTDNTLYVYDGTNWIDALSQGDYTFQNGIELAEGTRNVQIKLATGANAGNIAFTADANGLAASAPEASTTVAGLIEIATDAEFTTGTSETLAVNPKQVAGAIADFITLEDLSIAAASANYLEYDNITGEFGAKVDGTVTENSTNLITSGAVSTAIANALVGGVIYKGTWSITTATTDYSEITLPVKKGYMYYVAGEGPATVGDIEWNVGDYLLVNDDVAAGGSLVGKVEKIDNTEASDIVRLDATQTLTNKTISALANTISDLATGNFASGVISTVVAGTASASDTVIPTESAVANALAGATDGMVTVDGAQTLTNKTIDADDNTISDLELDNFKSGVVTTAIAGTASASDTKVATEKAIAEKLATKVEKFTATNSALTSVAGVCTWEIANSIGNTDVHVAIYRVADNAQVGAYVEAGASTITVKFNSADIAADTFKAVVLGL